MEKPRLPHGVNCNSSPSLRGAPGMSRYSYNQFLRYGTCYKSTTPNVLVFLLRMGA
jgi:hypothetical protein